jgi:ubiquinone/menaquinone biosynthesis C-methylase UbiE
MLKTLDADITNYYSRGKERDRLTRDENKLEHLRTQQLLTRYLPKAPATIYDVGGGAGVYALWLANQGYKVHLLDIMPLHVQQALEASEQLEIDLKDVVLGDARHLPYADSSADAVLLMGPLYHLTEHEERMQALWEAYRVLKPGGLVFAVSINRFASTLDGLFDEKFSDPTFLAVSERTLRTGQHRSPEGKTFFTTAYFHHPHEFHDEVQDAGFEMVQLLGIEGAGRLIQNFDVLWDDPVKRDWVLHIAEKLEGEETLLGISNHLMAIGRKTA